MTASKLIYVGIRGSVIALNRADGKAVWTQKLIGADFVNVALNGDNLYAATHGELFCLEAKTGRIRWHNRLKGYGWGLVSIAGEGIAQNSPALAAERRRQEESDAATAASVAASA